MHFTTDKQTLEDLNIFGKHGDGSVYNLFNHTRTLIASKSPSFITRDGNHPSFVVPSTTGDDFAGKCNLSSFVGYQLHIYLRVDRNTTHTM